MMREATDRRAMTRQNRYFDTGDEVTDANLRVLEHLSGNDAHGGEYGLFDIHIQATIGCYKMLPAAVRHHFRINPYVGDYYSLSDARREALWSGIAAGLDAGLTAVATDPALRRGGGADLSDRPQSMGERIIAACDALMAAVDRGGPRDGPLSDLVLAATGTPARGDADKLKRLFQMNRIPDYDAWRGGVIRAIWHAKDIAHNQHHRPAH
jgi:hypothetical protein